jgi:hypothetical protein
LISNQQCSWSEPSVTKKKGAREGALFHFRADSDHIRVSVSVVLVVVSLPDAALGLTIRSLTGAVPVFRVVLDV